MSNGGTSRGWVWILVLVLIGLHQDFWFWEDSSIVGGLMPVGLVYHACLSLAAAVVWLLAVRFAWPTDVDVELNTTNSDGQPFDSGGPQS